MISLLNRKKYYNWMREDVIFLYANLEDAIMLYGLIEYHKSMIDLLDQRIIKTTGILDAIFYFYAKDYQECLNEMDIKGISEERYKTLELRANADKRLIDELTTKNRTVNPNFAEIAFRINRLEKCNKKVPEKDKVNLDFIKNPKEEVKSLKKVKTNDCN